MFRGSQSDPSARVMVLFFPAHFPESPHKTIKTYILAAITYNTLSGVPDYFIH